MEAECRTKLIGSYRRIVLSSILLLIGVMVSNNSHVEGWTDETNGSWNGGQREVQQADDDVQFGANEKIWWSQLPKKESRSPKPNGSRPKYNPGLKWIGLGKRPDPSSSQLISQLPGPQVLVDMRRYFNGLLRHMRSFENNDYKSSEKISREFLPQSDDEQEKFVANGLSSKHQALRFATRSKGVKNTYNPSLLWTGLGR